MRISKKKARKLYHRGYLITFKFSQWDTTLLRFDPCDYDFNRIYDGIQHENQGLDIKCYATKTTN